MTPETTCAKAGRRRRPGLRRAVRAAIFVALILAGRSAGAADRDFLAGCPFEKGDSITKVRAFYGTSAEPQKIGAGTQPGVTTYRFYFPEYGVWVFFDNLYLVLSLRFDPPFAGKIGGIAMGATKDEVRRERGEPWQQPQGMVDAEALAARKQHKRDLVEALPDPAPKQQVLDAFAEVERLTTLLPPVSTAWVYGQQDFVRYDFEATNGTVHWIFASSCAAEK